MFFDLEEVPDVMNSLYKSDIKGKLYRLLYKMNESVNIKVKTPLGTSESKKTGPTVTQGGIEAALVSSNNIDVGVEETFIDGDDIGISPLLRDSFLRPHIADDKEEGTGAEVASLLEDLCRDAVRTRGLVVFQRPYCSLDFSIGWWKVKVLDGDMVR